MELTVHDLITGLNNGIANLAVQNTGAVVGIGTGLLQGCQHLDLLVVNPITGDTEIHGASERLYAVVRFGRDFQGADGIAF